MLRPHHQDHALEQPGQTQHVVDRVPPMNLVLGWGAEREDGNQ